MAEISTEDLNKLAELARLRFDSAELESFSKDIDSILSYVKQVQEVAIGEISNRPAGVYALLENQMRRDENPHPAGEFTEKILGQAPQRDGNYFKVKKIL